MSAWLQSMTAPLMWFAMIPEAGAAKGLNASGALDWTRNPEIAVPFLEKKQVACLIESDVAMTNHETAPAEARQAVVGH